VTVVSHNVSTRLQVTERTDTDGDSLWDAWENKTYQYDKLFLLSGRSGVSSEFSTDWQDPDTDGDGYWDGWVGVYNVSYDHDRGIDYADNLILYRETLASGVTGADTLDKQVGIHNVGEAPTPSDPARRGADVDGDGTVEHSNVHLGELHWRTSGNTVDGDPTDTDVTPAPSLEFEVDYDLRNELSQQTIETYLGDVTDNYALYGIEVTFEIDESLTRSELNEVNRTAPPYSWGAADEVRNEFHDDRSVAYMFVTTDVEDSGTTGRASRRGGTYPTGIDFGTAMFTQNLRSQNPREDFMTTAVHEVGHLFDAGFNDETGPMGEVYSGDSSDGTTEEIKLPSGRTTDTWSTMSSGWQNAYGDTPMNGNYVAFSIEELFTVDLESVDSRDPDP